MLGVCPAWAVSAPVSAGAVVQKRSPWRVSIIVDFFLAIVSLLTVL
jgi:hypothetical protein